MSSKVIKNAAYELTYGESKVLEMLKELYKNIEGEVYIYVQPTISRLRPDFVILDSIRGIAILEIKDWSETYIKTITKTKVVLEDRSEDNPLYKLKNYHMLISGVICTNSKLYDEVNESIYGTVIFTKLSDSDIEKNSFEKELIQRPMRYISSNNLKGIKINDIFGENRIQLDNKLMALLRVTLFPEVKIINSDNKEDEACDIKALDKEQEEFARRIPLGHYMVSGIPGSGKTVILLARAIHLIKEKSDWNVLILTYNKSLRNKLRSKLDNLSQELRDNLFYRDLPINNITIETFHQLTYKLSNGRRKPFDMDNDKWWNSEIVNIALKNARPMYDAILIDEYQDFYDEWIKLCIACCKKSKTLNNDRKEVELVNLFLAGDRLQSIYNPKETSWKQIGINMQGRSKCLKTSYRTASDHTKVAMEFLKKDKTLNKEVLKFYKDEEDDGEDIYIKTVNNGTIDFLEGNVRIVAAKIKELIEKDKYEYKDILILCKTANMCRSLIGKLDTKYKYVAEFVKDLDETNIDNKMIFTTYLSSKGLEAKVVILVNSDMYITRQDKELELLDRKLLYVGITRASEKLYIHAESFCNNSLAKEIKEIAEEILV